MIKKIAAFGDSFIYGTELTGNRDGTVGSWPSLISQELNLEYSCNAWPGVGNDAIAQQVLKYISNNPINETLFVINWTWIGRWDVFSTQADRWITLGPTCVPRNLEQFLDATQASNLLEHFHGHLNSQIGHKYRTLVAMNTVHSLLKQLGAAKIITNMDSTTFDKSCNAPPYISVLQDQLIGDIDYFEGKNFLDWSRDLGFEITPAWHPLELAHQAAANLWLPTYKKVIADYTKTYIHN